MDSASYLAVHQGGLGKVLGIGFVSAAADLVVARMDLRPEHFTRAGVVHGGVLMALGDCAGAYGAVLNLPDPGCATATIESKTNFLRRGDGSVLRAEARPVHVGRSLSVWRTAIYRGAGACIAEVTQTQLVLQPAQGASPEAAGDTAAAPGLAERIAHSGPRGFRTAVADERQRQIFEGACRVIAEKGFSKATIREIAAASEMPIPTMYQYLERKEDLLYKIYEFFMNDIAQGLQKWRRSTAPANVKIEGMIRSMINEFDRNHKYIKIMFQETRNLTPESRKLVYDLDKTYISIIQEVLDDAASRGEVVIDNTELAANYIYFLCVIWPLRHWTIGKFGQEEVTRSIVDLAQRGFGAVTTSGSKEVV